MAFIQYVKNAEMRKRVQSMRRSRTRLSNLNQFCPKYIEGGSMAEKYYYCEKCHKTLQGDSFYTSHNLEKYPNDGKLNICKDCITMHVDN